MVEKPCVVDTKICDTYEKYPSRCNLCSDMVYFVSKKEKTPAQMRKQKKSNRMGANFEEENSQANKKLLKAVSDLTPNSGAGTIKGDEQITGIVNIMEELKTAVVPKMSRGSLSFSIKKEWLEKLDKEAKLENKELWYLKFKFLENDDKTYVVIDSDVMMSLVASLVHDRQQYNLADSRVNVYKTKYISQELKIAYLESAITQLQSENDYLKKLLANDMPLELF